MSPSSSTDLNARAFGLGVYFFIATPGSVNSNQRVSYRKDINFHIFRGTVSDISSELGNSKFIGCATIVVALDRERLCDPRDLALVLRALKANKYLRYKSKFILCHYSETILHWVDRELRWKNFAYFIQHSSERVREDSCCPCVCHEADVVKLDFRPHARFGYANRLQDVRKGLVKCDYDTFQSLCIDNTIFMQLFQDEQCDLDSEYHRMWEEIYVDKELSIQRFILGHNAIELRRSVVTISTNADLYFYNINPALAIVINNYYFTEPHTIRMGSDRDVIHLIRELKIAGIPYILLEDCSRQDLFDLLDYIEKKDFNPLKNLLWFLMSHGDTDNVIYTHDGQLDLKEDILKRIQANTSLRNTDSLIVVNACRGSIDSEYADEEELLQIQPTDGRNLTKNIAVLYSVSNHLQSPRCPKTGSPFVQTFTRIFRNADHTCDMKTMGARINDKLKNFDYFHGLDRCSEFVSRDPVAVHKIRHMTVKAKKMLQLVQSIADEFPIRESGAVSIKEFPLFYICGSINTQKFSRDTNVGEYFDKDLDTDLWSATKGISENMSKL